MPILASLLALAIVAGGSLSAAPAYAATTAITVTSTADADANGACASSAVSATSIPVTLRNALCVANNIGGAAVVTVPAGNYALASGLGALRVGTTSGANITLVGAGQGATAITGDGTNQVMILDEAMVGGVAVTLSGLTVTGGVDNVFGGGGIIGGSGNATTADSLTLTGTTVTGNRANTTGSATNNPGGGIQFIGGKLTITNSIISNNSSGSSAGGGVAYQAMGIANEGLTIAGSVFSGNGTATATGLANGGGALVIENTSAAAAIASVTNSVFTANTAAGAPGKPGRGGAILQRGGTLNLDRSTFTDNSISPADSASGAALHVDGGTLNAQYNRITGNVGGSGLALGFDAAGPTGATAAAANNWWGCSPGITGCNPVSPATPASVYTPYLTLTATASTTPIIDPVTTTVVTASLLKNSAGASISAANLTAFANLAVGWGAPLPAGATVSPGTTTLSNGISTATFDARGTAGTGSVTATLDNGLAKADLAIHTRAAVTSGSTANFMVGAAGSYTLSTSGYPAPSIALDAAALPSGLTLVDNGNGTATLAGTPAAGSGRDYSRTITATNGVVAPAAAALKLHVAEAPAFGSAASATFATGQPGSFTIGSTGFPVASPLALAGSLPAGVGFTDNGDGTATLAGTPTSTAGGSYPLTLTAKNGAAPDAVQAFTLTVTQPAAVIVQPLPTTALAGSTLSFSAAATGFPAPTVQWQQSSNGGTYSNLAGATSTTLTFTADQAQSGTLFRAVFSNGSSTTTAAALLTVVTPPAITSAASATFTVDGSKQSFAVTSTGSPEAVLTISGAPAWLTLVDRGDGTATVSGTPPAASGGQVSLTLTATNGYGTDAAQPFTLTITEATRITSVNSVRFTVGQAGSFTVATRPGYPSVVTIRTSASLPAGLSFTDNGDGTATVAGTPAAGTGNLYSIPLSAGNGIAADAVQTLSLTVNEAPVVTLQPADAAVTVGSPVSFSSAASGYPAPAIQWQVATSPGGSFADLAGEAGQTLNLTAAQTQDGNQYRAVFDNGQLAASNEATLAVGTSPALTSDSSATFRQGGGLQSFTVRSSGVPAANLSATGTLPDWLTLTDAGDGTAVLSGNPAVGSAGDHNFTIEAANRFGVSAAQSFTLRVTTAPTITSGATAAFTAGTAGTYTVTTIPGFPAATALTLTGALPAGLGFTDNGDGTATLSGAPVAGTGGQSAVWITASNAGTASNAQVLQLTVNEAPTITSAATATLTVGTAKTITITTGHSYPAATVLSLAGSLPVGMTFTDNQDGTASLAGTAMTGTGGTSSLTVRADNGIGPVATQALSLVVLEAPAVMTTPSDQRTNAGSQVTFAATATGYPSPAIQWQVAADNTGAFNDVAGATSTTLSFPASQVQNGTRYRAVFSNGIGTAVESSAATLTVGNPPAITTAAGTVFRVDGTTQAFRVESTGAPHARLTLTGTVPGWLQLVDNGDGTADLTGTPPAGAGGEYSVSIGADNGFVPAGTQTFTVSVTEPPRITSPGGATFEVGVAQTIIVTTDGGHPAEPTIGLIGTLPDGLTFTDNHDGTATLAGTAAGGTGGAHTVTVTARNAAASASQTLTVTVAEAAHLTSAADATFTHGIIGSFTVTSAGGWPSAAGLSLTGALPDGLTFTDNGDGSARLGGLTVAEPGTFPVTVTVTNGVGSGTSQTLQVHVSAAVAVPVPVLPPDGAGRLDGVPAHATPGAVLHLTASGFAAGSPVTFIIYSTPQVLGTASADSTGTARISVALPAELRGSHTVVAAGVDSQGDPRFERSQIVISDPPATSDAGTSGAAGLPRSPVPAIAVTGVPFDVTLTALLALLTVAAGLALVIRLRRTATAATRKAGPPPR
jgi:Putative Ig domain/Immunoglobulin I-set domain